MTRRRRRRGATGDSLELLLDTICNTFGGIVFIALLIVLLLRETGTRSGETPVETASPDEIERLAGELESVTAELTSLRTAVADLSRRAEAFAPDEVRELLKRRNGLAAQTGTLHGDRDRQVSANASATAELNRGEAEHRNRIAQLPDARQEVARLEAELEAIRRSKVEEIRNPVVRNARAFRHVGLIVRYGRVYVWHRFSADGERLGLNTDDFVVVEDRGDKVVTHPDPTKGILLSPGEPTAKAIRDRLRSFPSSRWYCEIVVRPDSFDEFNVLRDALVDEGYEYRLMPTAGSVADRGGNDDRVQ
ncbi:MAG: hypothetical protein WBC44_01345 [Planctomycetaceae bacterium]